MGASRRIDVRAFLVCSVTAVVVASCGSSATVQGGEGTGGPGGTAGSKDGSASTSESQDAALADGSGENGEGGEPGDASDDATLQDEPCPPKIDIDCSTSCEGEKLCYEVRTCEPSTTVSIAPEEFPFVIRTPASPGALTWAHRCEQYCGGTIPNLYALTLNVRGAPSIRARVEPPWRVTSRISTNEACGYLKHSCANLLHFGFAMTLVIGTDDPNAPARNVILEATNEPCPGDPF